MLSRKKLVIAALTICLITVALFLQIGVFANQPATAGDFTVEAEAYDVFYDCNRDGKVDMLDIFGCILRYGTEGEPVRTSYLSVPPAAFIPTDESFSYRKYVTYIMGDGGFQAEVQLPHGATVTRLIVWFLDDVNDGYIDVILGIVQIAGHGSYIMSEVYSSRTATPGFVCVIDDTINYPIIDNLNCQYRVSLALEYESQNLALFGVIIEYEYTP